jgi:hypothetical protein
MPDLDGSTTWTSHIQNMEEKAWPGGSDKGPEPILQHQKMFFYSIKNCLTHKNTVHFTYGGTDRRILKFQLKIRVALGMLG